MTKTRPNKGDFCIEIQFERGTESPTRIFQAMTELVEAFQQVDKTLVEAIDIHIEPILLLEDIESGSLRAWFRSALEAIPDEGLASADWKKAVGHYLVRGKYFLLDFIKDRGTISDREDIVLMQDNLQQLAEETEVNRLPAYSPPEPKRLMNNLGRVTSALSHLTEKDSAFYEGSDGKVVPFNMTFSIEATKLEEILTKEVLEHSEVRILQVKKPDYIGSSQWEFRYEGQVLFAKFEDEYWLKLFQNRDKDVRPGDSLRVNLRVEVSYGHDNEVIATHYFITEVIAIVPPPTQHQFFDD